MYRIVLDTNVIISAIIHSGKPRRLLQKAVIEEKYTLVMSDEMLNEVKEILNRPKFRMPESKVEQILFALVLSSDIRKAKSKFKVVMDDPDDDIVINTAFDGQADYCFRR